MSATTVFLSYADDTKPFVDEFSYHFFLNQPDLVDLGRGSGWAARGSGQP